MISKLSRCPLFAQMNADDISHCLACSSSELVTYEKDQPIFFQQDKPQKLFILVEGSVAICRDTASGQRSRIATISESGDLFGEVFLFLDKQEYDYYAVAVKQTKVLQMPKEYLYCNCGKHCNYHTLLISNMLSVLAQKAYYLNQKLQIMSSLTLRQKIAKILLQNVSADGAVTLCMNREELADFLNTTRPSLSRELMKMQANGLLKIEGKQIRVLDLEQLQQNL